MDNRINVISNGKVLHNYEVINGFSKAYILLMNDKV